MTSSFILNMKSFTSKVGGVFLTRQQKLESWFEKIVACRQSGLSDKQWCIQNQISTGTFYYWVKQLKKCNNISIPEHNPIPTATEQQVVPLRILDEPVSISSETAIVMRVQGMELEIKNGADEETIAHTLSALRRLC
jgi:transposase-like protein